MDIFEQMDLALAESYGNGFEAGVKLTCEELVKIFEGIPMWGTVAVSKVKAFLDTYSKIVNTREGENTVQKSEVTEEGILHCPFCGNIDLEVEQHQTAQMENILFTSVVRCGKCGTNGPTASCKVSAYDSRWDAREHMKQKAIELWNNRV